MLTAYPNSNMAQTHLNQLQAGDGKVLELQLPENVEKLKNLSAAGSGYQFYYSATRDKDARQKLVKEYGDKIRQYSRTNYRGNFEFGIKVEAGQLYGIYSYEKQSIGTLFIDIIK